MSDVNQGYSAPSLKEISFRQYTNMEEKQRAELFKYTRPAHIRPDSVYVFSIGTSWAPGAWEKVINMVAYTIKEGICCWFHEIKDIYSQLPYSYLNQMRNIACIEAHNSGCEWVLIVENDILPEPDMLVRLLKWQMPVVSPFMWDEKFKQPIARPAYERGNGLKAVEWSALSCILIWCRVLHCFPYCEPFRDVGTEAVFFNRLLNYGHRAYQDTDTELKLASGPSYHGDNKSMDDLLNYYRKVDKNRRKVPDRHPIDPNNPEAAGGVYLPSSLFPRIQK